MVYGDSATAAVQVFSRGRAKAQPVSTEFRLIQGVLMVGQCSFASESSVSDRLCPFDPQIEVVEQNGDHLGVCVKESDQSDSSRR